MTKKTLFSIFISLTLLVSGISIAATHSSHRVSKTKVSSTLKKKGSTRTLARRNSRVKRGSQVSKASDQIVNINRADAKTIATLKGVGLHKAERIAQYREEHGKFKSVDDLAKVKGISEKTIAKNRDRLKLR